MSYALAETSPNLSEETGNETGAKVAALGRSVSVNSKIEVDSAEKTSLHEVDRIATRFVPATDELRGKIATDVYFPSKAAQDQEQSVVVEIVDDNRIRVSDRELLLKNERTLLFNAVVILSDRPRAVSDYMRLINGADASGYSLAFSKRLLRMMDAINKLDDTNIIGKTGVKAGTKYTFDAKVIDKREFPPTFDNIRLFEEKTPTIPKKARRAFRRPATKKPPVKLARKHRRRLPILPIGESARAEFGSLQERGDVFTEILRDYKGHPRVNELLNYVMLPATDVDWQRGMVETPGDYFPKFRSLSKGELDQLFGHIEKALSRYQELGGEKPTDDDIALFAELAAAHSVVFNCNLGLAFARTGRFGYDRREPVFSDLLQNAFIGLDQGIKRFQHWRGHTLSTYVNFWIDQSLKRNYSKVARAFGLPDTVDQDLVNYSVECTQLAQELQRVPTPEEISKYSGKSLGEMAALESYTTTVSLNTPISKNSHDGKVTELLDILPFFDEKDRLPTPTYSPEKHLEIEKMFLAAELSPRSRLLLSMKFGIYLPDFESVVFDRNGQNFTYRELMEALHASGRELSHDDIALLLGIKEDSVVTRINNSLRKLESHPQVQQFVNT